MKILKHAFKRAIQTIQRGFHKEDADKESQEEQTETEQTEEETEIREPQHFKIHPSDSYELELGATLPIHKDYFGRCVIPDHQVIKDIKTSVNKDSERIDTDLTLNFNGATVQNLIDYATLIAVIRIQTWYRSSKIIPATDTQNIIDVFDKGHRKPKESDETVAKRHLKKMIDDGMTIEQIMEFVMRDVK